MSERRVEVIGGGPAGLLAARLLALTHPEWKVTLHEQLSPDDTFGFGVGLTHRLLALLRSADREVHNDLVSALVSHEGVEFRFPQGNAVIDQSHAGAIGRARMLRVLMQRARAAGAELRIGSRITLAEVRERADLVVAADGVSSETRERLSRELGASAELGRGLYIWCASPTRLQRTVFQPVQTSDGIFVAHAYPYAKRLATIVIEASEAAIQRAGCCTAIFNDEQASDELALDYLSNVFEDLLEGHRLIGNRSRWLRFRTVHCRCWHHENIVLLGDAKATVHPSLGSGTKLALEDAVALGEAVADAPGLAARLADYEIARRPAVERLQDRAHRSQLWWESLDRRLHLGPAQMAVAYLSRAGAVSLRELVVSEPALARMALREWAGTDPGEVCRLDITSWVMSRELACGPRQIECRLIDRADATLSVACGDPWGETAQALVEQAHTLRKQGVHVIGLEGGCSRSEVLDRIALGERIRVEVGALVAVRSSREHLDDLLDGLVGGRIDLAMLQDCPLHALQMDKFLEC